MRALNRPACGPPTLRADGVGGQQAASDKQRRRDDTSSPLPFPAHWRSADVLGALRAMQGRTCAYCTRTLDAQRDATVDHFRPKKAVCGLPNHGGYWWLAYDYENLFFACLYCQGTKGTHFPLLDDSKRHNGPPAADTPHEPRALLDPAQDPVDALLRYAWRGGLCKVMPSRPLSAPADEQVEASIRLLRLNTAPHLAQARRRVKREVLQHLKAYKSGGEHGHNARWLTARAVCFRDHSALVKQILARFAPELLPSPEFELLWLLNDITHGLDEVRKLAAVHGPTDELERERGELLWALAFARMSAPPELVELVEGFLREQRLSSVVAPLRASLEREPGASP